MIAHSSEPMGFCMTCIIIYNILFLTILQLLIVYSYVAIYSELYLLSFKGLSQTYPFNYSYALIKIIAIATHLYPY